MDESIDYDALPPEEQARMRERWPGQFATRIAELDLVTEFEEHGLAYAALDARGEVVVHIPGETDVRD